MNLADLVGAILGFTLTLFVFSYLIGDNALFRLAIHIFIGVAAAYVAVVAIYNVILYQVVFPLFRAPLNSLAILLPAFFGLWLLVSKSSVRLSRWGNPVMAFLVGVGAAVAIGGALLGTVFPQVGSTMNLFDWNATPDQEIGFLAFLARGILILAGVLVTLIYFHFGTRPAAGDQPAQRPAWMEALGQVGQIFVAITLGVLFAGVYAAALTAFIERVQSLINFLRPFITL